MPTTRWLRAASPSSLVLKTLGRRSERPRPVAAASGGGLGLGPNGLLRTRRTLIVARLAARVRRPGGRRPPVRSGSGPDRPGGGAGSRPGSPLDGVGRPFQALARAAAAVRRCRRLPNSERRRNARSSQQSAARSGAQDRAADGDEQHRQQAVGGEEIAARRRPRSRAQACGAGRRELLVDHPRLAADFGHGPAGEGGDPGQRQRQQEQAQRPSLAAFEHLAAENQRPAEDDREQEGAADHHAKAGEQRRHARHAGQGGGVHLGIGRERVPVAARRRGTRVRWRQPSPASSPSR